MSTKNIRKTSALTEFFTNTPADTRREILMGAIDKANTSQREVVQKADAIKAARACAQGS
ncbi:hypothetical protein DYL59_13795 [Pseudomonas kairouanensis]|uniref:Uncharacterized protein n=1 Tax=Pseudomonas kairouanensis TaxID=2293832 RepID=A0A4Z0AQ73_9PSED|nr:hypothetical protein [Pseudomonas kairouanensis]TFY88966.1 hypothetical protein DYL59_13795 [Pseudomonas kairouanensis]